MKWKNRLTNYNFWVSMVSAVLLVLQAFDLKFDIAHLNEIVTAILGLLVVIGIINDPTKTATNSKQTSLVNNNPQKENLTNQTDDKIIAEQNATDIAEEVTPNLKDEVETSCKNDCQIVCPQIIEEDNYMPADLDVENKPANLYADKIDDNLVTSKLNISNFKAVEKFNNDEKEADEFLRAESGEFKDMPNEVKINNIISPQPCAADQEQIDLILNKHLDNLCEQNTNCHDEIQSQNLDEQNLNDSEDLKSISDQNSQENLKLENNQNFTNYKIVN